MKDGPTGLRRQAPPEADPELIAIQALIFIGADPERLERFLALSGLGPDALRGAARDPDFLAGLMDHVVSDEALVLGVAAQAGIPPERVVEAHARLSGRW